MTAKAKLPRVFQVLLWTCNEAEVKEETNDDDAKGKDIDGR